MEIKAGVLSEDVRTLEIGPGAAPVGENPYWRDPAPHPDPARGCIRRGACCTSSPGWFGPGEAEGAAALLGMEPDAFVRRYCVIDGIELPDHGRVEVFAPLKLGRDGEPALPPVSRVDDWYRFLRGTCIFYASDGCSIYAARPTECRGYVCTNAPEDNPSHESIARLWIESSR